MDTLQDWLFHTTVEHPATQDQICDTGNKFEYTKYTFLTMFPEQKTTVLIRQRRLFNHSEILHHVLTF